MPQKTLCQFEISLSSNIDRLACDDVAAKISAQSKLAPSRDESRKKGFLASYGNLACKIKGFLSLFSITLVSNAYEAMGFGMKLLDSVTLHTIVLSQNNSSPAKTSRLIIGGNIYQDKIPSVNAALCY